MCFIKIHKVNSSKYEWSLDLLSLTVKSLSETQKGHKGFSLEGMFLKLATFIYKLYTDITLFKHELMLHIFKGSNFYLQIIH